MSRKPGVHILGNLKKKIIHKPVNAQRVFISDAQNSEIINTEENPDEKIFDARDFDPNEDMNLEDTPSGGMIAQGREKKVKQKKEHKRKDKNIADKLTPDISEPIKENKARTARYRKRNRGVFGGLLDTLKGLPYMIRSPKSNSSALEFAGSGKRLTKKDKRNRRILIYGGTGLLIAAVALVIIFVFGGTVASANDTTPSAAVATNTLTANTTPSVSSATGSATIEQTTTPPPTQTATPIPTTAQDVTPVPLSINDEVKTFQVKATKSKPYYGGYSSNHYKYSDENYSEYYALAKTMEGESSTLEGRIAVGNVIINRILSNNKGWPNTIIGVVSQPNQFHGYYSDKKPSAGSLYAARLVMDQEDWIVPQNIYFFGSANATRTSSPKYYKTIGGNAFSYASKNYGRTGKIPPQYFQRVYQWPTVGCEPDNRVYKLQYILNKLGYDVTADKQFGETTVKAIKKFQTDHKLKSDGIAGQGTIKALINAYVVKFGDADYYNRFCK